MFSGEGDFTLLEKKKKKLARCGKTGKRGKLLGISGRYDNEAACRRSGAKKSPLIFPPSLCGMFDGDNRATSPLQKKRA